jgi:hypothetical protein
MGNEASAAMAVANAKSNINKQLDQINEKLATQPKSDGPKNKREHQQRRKEREEEYKDKQAERAARKQKLAEKWSTHHHENTALETKKGFFSRS